MSARPPFWDDRRLLLLALKGARLPHQDEFLKWVEDRWRAYEGRANAGRDSAGKHSSRVDDGIRKAYRAAKFDRQLPNGVRVRPEWVLDKIASCGPEAFDLKRMPRIETVRRVVRNMEREKSSDDGTVSG